MDAIIAGLIAWTVAKTGWIVQTPPRIVFVPESRLVEMYYGAIEPPKNAHIAALYAPREKTIYLPTTWNKAQLASRGALLHELVHHLQRANHVKVPCVAAYERQSYDLHIAWLREQGVADPYKVIGTDEFTIRLMSMCD